MRLIDADELIVEFLRYPMMLRHSGDFVAVNLDAIIYEVRKASTIEAEPVKHGVWDFVGENNTGKIFFCSVCGIPYNPSEKEVDRGRLQERPNFCPNCGARMDGDIDE